jgi:hypothetical protein
MLRVQWKPTVASVALTFVISSMAEGSPAGHIASAVAPAAGEVSHLVLKVHGRHLACRFGPVGKYGRNEWHRQDRGATYPCAPESTGSQPYYGAPTGGGSGRGGPPSRGTPAAGGKTGTTTYPATGGKTGTTAVPHIIPPPSSKNSIKTVPGLNTGTRFSPSTSGRK